MIRRSILIAIACCIGQNCYAQIPFIIPIFLDFEDSAETAIKYRNAEINLKRAYDAYQEGNLEKTKYYLDESERRGVVSPEFYLLLGQYFYAKQEYKYARRYWRRGFKKGCWECNEKINTIPIKGTSP